MLRTVNKLLCCKTSVSAGFCVGLNSASSYAGEAALIRRIKYRATQAAGQILPPLTLAQSDNSLSQNREVHELR